MPARILLILLLMLSLLSIPSLHGGEIALSFDDAPRGDGAFFSGQQRTETLIRKLRDLKVPQVIFFCTTQHISRHQGAARLTAYARAGHLLANHTHTHPNAKRTEIEAYIGDIRQAHDLLRDRPGFSPFFRFPMLNQGRDSTQQSQVQHALKDMGYQHGYVTVDNYDWSLNLLVTLAKRDGKTVDMDGLKQAYCQILWSCIQHYDQLAQKTLGRSPRHVLLLHENDLAALFIDALVTHIRAKGWKIISPTVAYQDPLVEVLPKQLCNQGRIACLATEAGVTKAAGHVSEDTDYLKRILAERKIFK